MSFNYPTHKDYLREQGERLAQQHTQTAKQVTVVYYTANCEAPLFEAKITERLQQHAGTLPIISVSQKPMALGTNICVGDVGMSNLNGFRQMLIGAEAATTPYVLFAEADFLYPKEYFEFVPPAPGMYYYDSVWIVHRITRYGRGAFRKKMSEGARVCDRESFVRAYDKWLKRWPTWSRTKIDKKCGDPFMFEEHPGRFGGPPVVSFKSGLGLRYVTHHDKQGVLTLPTWGDIPTLRRTMFDKSENDYYTETDLAVKKQIKDRT